MVLAQASFRQNHRPAEAADEFITGTALICCRTACILFGRFGCVENISAYHTQKPFSLWTCDSNAALSTCWYSFLPAASTRSPFTAPCGTKWAPKRSHVYSQALE